MNPEFTIKCSGWAGQAKATASYTAAYCRRGPSIRMRISSDRYRAAIERATAIAVDDGCVFFDADQTNIGPSSARLTVPEYASNLKIGYGRRHI